MRALVIDDSKALRALMARILGQLGLETHQAGDGREGLEVLEKEGPFDLALVDWNMPVMDGLEFVRAVRADGRYGDLKVVMCTTETEIERVGRALEAGADEYVMKPFTPAILGSKLEAVGLVGTETP